MRAGLSIALLLAVSTGCVTGNAIIKVKPPSVPVFVVTVVADLLTVGIISSQIDGFTGGAITASTLAITAVDVAVGCLFGACAPLHP